MKIAKTIMQHIPTTFEIKSIVEAPKDKQFLDVNKGDRLKTLVGMIQQPRNVFAFQSILRQAVRS